MAAISVPLSSGTALAAAAVVMRASGAPAAAPATPPSRAPIGEDALPAGHPPVSDTSSPHGQGGSIPGMFQPPADLEQPDAALAPGSIVVDLRDADGKAVSGDVVTLGILVNSVAKGDSRTHLQATADATGRATFSGLETASNVAYRVSVGHQGGLFVATPFQLQQARAMHVVLHVYPVVHDIQQAVVVDEATVAAEVRDDRIQVEEALTVYNLGKTAWEPLDVSMKLPGGVTAFTAQPSMSDQSVDASDGRATLHGTFPPGRHVVDFRWQVPWSGDADVDFTLGLPPHVAIARVMVAGTPAIKLDVEGFPPAAARHDDDGQSFLVTERQLRPDDPRLTQLAIGIHDLPAPGPGRLLAVLLAACGVAVGLAFTTRGRGRAPALPGAEAARAGLLEELAELERARGTGAVGPKTYERARRELIDMVARTLVKN